MYLINLVENGRKGKRKEHTNDELYKRKMFRSKIIVPEQKKTKRARARAPKERNKTLYFNARQILNVVQTTDQWTDKFRSLVKEMEINRKTNSRNARKNYRKKRRRKSEK